MMMVSWNNLVKIFSETFTSNQTFQTETFPRHKVNIKRMCPLYVYHQTKIQPCVIQKATTLKQITSRFPGKCKQIFTKCRPVKRCRADSINLIKNTGSCGIRGGTVYPQRRQFLPLRWNLQGDFGVVALHFQPGFIIYKIFTAFCSITRGEMCWREWILRNYLR